MIGSTWMKVIALPCLLLVAIVAVMYFEPSEPSIQQKGEVALQESAQHVQSLALFKHAAIEDVYVYAGKEEHTRHLVPFICRLIKRHRFRLNIHQFFSVDDAPLRSVLWSHDSRVVIFPPFESYPQISSKGFTDLRAYVAAGNNIVFMGSYIALQVMNDAFGFSLRDDYKEGPYYRNDRNVRGTEFEYLPSRLNEPSPRVYGAMAKSLPPGAFSLYDSLGSVVVFYVRYDLGTIVYIGYQFDNPYQIDSWVRVIHAAMAM
jgi:hypothetical protein